MSSELAMIPMLSSANRMAVEHAELVVALYAAATALDKCGRIKDACEARVVLNGMARRAVH
jgi:hypothetical protein